jgi:DNA polymerase elongation subunit (family B)
MPTEAFVPDSDVGDGAGAAPAVRYRSGADTIPGLPTRADIVRREAGGRELADRLDAEIARCDPVYFNAVDHHETTAYAFMAARAAGGQGARIQRQVYKLHLYGTLLNGAKAVVILDDLPVFTDVLADTPEDEIAAYALAGRLVDDAGESILREIEPVEGYPFRGWQEKQAKWLRFHFYNVRDRRRALADLHDQGFATAHDDRTYYLQVARNLGLAVSGWSKMTNYRSWFGQAHPYGGTATTWDTPAVPQCEYAFRVSAKHFLPMAPAKPVRGDTPEAAAERLALAATTAFSRPKAVVATWDIETYDAQPTGDVPRADRPSATCFMVALTLSWRDDATPLERVCIVATDSEPDPRWHTVVCDDEAGLVQAFGCVLRAWAPDYIVGFNDGDYDWHYMLTTAENHGLLGWLVDMASAFPRAPNWRPTTDASARYRYNDTGSVTDTRVKLHAEAQAAVEFLRVRGCVPVDARTCYRKLFPKAEKTSLNFFLRMAKLELKADMPYKVMWDAWIARDARRMRWVAHYCVVDAQRCQELLVRRNVLGEAAELSALAFTATYDAVYNAGGQKVRNQLGGHAYDMGIFFSSVVAPFDGTAKYAGAYVFQPERGLIPDPTEPSVVEFEAARAEYLRSQAETPQRAAATEAVRAVLRSASDRLEDLQAEVAARGDDPAFLRPEVVRLKDALRKLAVGRPLTGLDFSSLYPSIIMAYNLSPEKYIATPERAAYARSKGHSLHEVDAEYGGQRVRAWFVRHGCVPENYGLYPRILMDLFAKRAEVKKVLAVLEHQLEDCGILAADAKRCGSLDEALRALWARRDQLAGAEGAEGAEKELKDAGGFIDLLTGAGVVPRGDSAAQAAAEDAFKELQADLRFRFVAVDTKQKAIKVLMNTFYGEAGNKQSPTFLLALSLGVTSAGQYNIQMVADDVRRMGYNVKYGDSVAGHTALIVRQAGVVLQSRIDSLHPRSWTDWDAWHGDKQAFEPHDLEVWTETGFVAVRRVIRHAAGKPMLRVSTTAGTVDVTTDHSMVDEIGRIVKPTGLRPGSRLLKSSSRALARELAEGPAVTPETLAAVQCDTVVDEPFAYVLSVDPLPPPAPGEYVYDLETASGHFGVAPLLVVHNTDSLYLQCPHDRFRECDTDYALGLTDKEAWWAQMVEITMVELDKLRDHVNATLRADNGTPHLKMAYEEVLYPCHLTRKKGYYGIPHVGKVNFHPDKLFIRGIESIKQGHARLMVEICSRVMWACMAVDNEGTPLQHVEAVLRDAIVNHGQWDFADFVRTMAWKPDKQNPVAHRFYARMCARLAFEKAAAARGQPPAAYTQLPDAGERFEYVQVRVADTFSLSGRKCDIKVGDQMEYAATAKAQNLDINIEAYLTGAIAGTCAGFANCDERFSQPSVADGAARVKKETDAAKKHIIAFIGALRGADPAVVKARGYAYKRAYKAAAIASSGTLRRQLGAAADVLHGDWVAWDAFTEPGGAEGDTPSSRLAAAAKAFADERALTAAAADLAVDKLALASGRDVFALSARRARTMAPFFRALDQSERRLRAEIDRSAPAAETAAVKYELALEALVTVQRRREHDAAPGVLGEFAARGEAAATGVFEELPLTDEERAALGEIREAWTALAGVYLARADDRTIVAALERRRSQRIGYVVAPSRRETFAEREELAAQGAARAAARVRAQGGGAALTFAAL